MAISSDNLSIEGVENILEAGNTAYHNLIDATTDNQTIVIQQAIDRILNKIGFLEKLEDNLLSKFKGVNTREELQEKIDEYTNTDFKMFYGEDLAREFLRQFNKETNARRGNKKQQENAFAELILERIMGGITEENVCSEDVRSAIVSKFGELLGVVNKAGHRSSTHYHKLSPIGGSGTKKDPAYIIVENLSDTTRERLSELMAQLNSKNKNREKEMIFTNFEELQDMHITSAEVKAKAKEMKVRVKSEWLQETEMLTGKEIEAKCNLPGDEGEFWRAKRNQTNINIINLICKKVSSKMAPLVKEILGERVKTYPNFFYITSGTDITGILGELAAVVAIKELTGQEVNVDWTAEKLREGDKKKISVDIVLKEILDIDVVHSSDSRDVGINVKSSSLTEELAKMSEHGISFVKRDPESILDTLLSDLPNIDTVSLSNAFQTSYFNVTYQIFWKADKKDHVQSATSNKVHFENIAADLINFREKLIIYLYRFAPEMLFMATDELEKTLLVLDSELDKSLAGGGNILYFVRGQVYFPSQMLNELVIELKKIKEELDNSNKTKSLPSSSLFQISRGSSDDIIDFLNNRAQHNQSVALRDINANEYSGKLATIAMQTAYNGFNKK